MKPRIRRYVRHAPRWLLALSWLLVAACATTGTASRVASNAEGALVVVSANLRTSSAPDGANAWPLRKAGALASCLADPVVRGSTKAWSAELRGAFIVRRWYNPSEACYYSLAVIPR